MSSITGSCESPITTLFQKSQEKALENQQLEENREQKDVQLNIQASNTENEANNNSSNNANTQSQYKGAVGQLVDVFA